MVEPSPVLAGVSCPISVLIWQQIMFAVVLILVRGIDNNCGGIDDIRVGIDVDCGEIDDNFGEIDDNFGEIYDDFG